MRDDNKDAKENSEVKERKFVCMYMYKNLPRHDNIKLDQESQLLSLLYRGKVVHTEKIVSGHVIKCDIHMDYMIIEAKNMKEAKEKLIRGCNFHIIGYLVEDANNIKRLLEPKEDIKTNIKSED